jgi:transposase
MEPSPEQLNIKVSKEYADHEVEVIYECGCFGYWSHRIFESYGWVSYVVNPSDLPRINKQKFQKTDAIDARNLSNLLKLGLVRNVSIPDIKREQFRGLFRRRMHLVKYGRSIKVRIKNLLIYYGRKIPEEMDNASWSHGFRNWLENLEWEYPTAKSLFQSSLKQEKFLHYEINEISNQLRKYCREEYKEPYDLLQTIPGIGPLTAICFIAEVGDISRFKNFKHLTSLVGLMPTTYQSSDTHRTQGLTPRCLSILRSYLVEAAWQAVRIDPVMQGYYRKHVGKKPNNIIIKVARKLLSRIYGVLRTKTEYQIGLIQ